MIIFKAAPIFGESEELIGSLSRLINEYKNEEHILNGGTISENELRMEEGNYMRIFNRIREAIIPN